jgi:hypothetical protein
MYRVNFTQAKSVQTLCLPQEDVQKIRILFLSLPASVQIK